MAIDTAAKRFRMLDFDVPTAPGLPPPDGTISQDDRTAFLWLYLPFGAPEVIEPVAISVGASLSGSVNASGRFGATITGAANLTPKITRPS